MYTFGPFLLDPARRLLVRDGQPIPLTPKAFDTLVTLVERRDRVTSKDELLQLVWPGVVVEEGNLSQQISHLRRALEDEGHDEHYIATVPKRGYRFVAAVTQPEDVQERSVVPWRLWATRSVATVLLAVLATLVTTAIVRRLQPNGNDVVRFAIAPPHGARFTFLALSPDGGRLVFALRDAQGDNQLWVRSLDALESRALPGTEGGFNPFWSPDNRHIGFFAHGKLRTIDVIGGPPEALCDAPNPRGGSWNRSGVIIFAPDSRSGLSRVPSTGGSPTRLTVLDPSIRAGSHRWPQFLPDGRHFLYLLWSGEVAKQGVYVGSIDSSDAIRLVDANSSVSYAPSGYLLFVREETLMAQVFDAERLKLSGHAFSVATGLGRRTSTYAPFSISERGALAYVAVDPRTRLVWFDRGGRELESLSIQPGRQEDPAVSPDGHLILWGRNDPETQTPDIFLFDRRDRATTRLTFDPSVDVLPIWSPDGSQFAFRSNRNGPGDLYVKSLVGNAEEELLLRNAARKDPTDWSPDSRFILYDNYDGEDPTRESDIWVVPLFGDRKPSPYQHKAFSAWGGRFAPDGQWIAYAADESGTDDVYIQAFPATGVTYRVSRHGGSQPAWRRDGRELFYLAGDGVLTACSVQTHKGVVEVGTPTPLFHPTLRSSLLRNHYDVAPNGDRFLINTPVQDETTAPITVVLNWNEELKQRVPTR